MAVFVTPAGPWSQTGPENSISATFKTRAGTSHLRLKSQHSEWLNERGGRSSWAQAAALTCGD